MTEKNSTGTAESLAFSAPGLCSPFLGGMEDGAAAGLEARPFFGKILLRGLGEDKAFLKAAESALGTALPLVPNTTAAVVEKGAKDAAEGFEGGWEEGRIFWMGPSEWLVWTSRRGELLSALGGGLGGTHSAAADVSDYYAVLRVSGGLSREVLAHGCPLDLDDGAFGAGMCAQTRFRAAAIMLYRADDSPTYDIQVRWSFAEYLRRYLAEVSGLCAAARKN